MKIHTLFFCCAIFSSALMHADDQLVLPPETAKLKTGAGSDLASARCMMCHSVDYISTQPPLTATAWKNVVVKMQAKFGAPIAPADIDPLVDYLMKNYGAK